MDENEEKKKADIEVVNGTGENLNISPVYDHIKVDKPNNKTDKKGKIVVPKKKNK